MGFVQLHPPSEETQRYKKLPKIITHKNPELSPPVAIHFDSEGQRLLKDKTDVLEAVV